VISCFLVENRVLRRIFGQVRDGVTGGWRKLQKEELRNLYSSPSTYNQNDQVEEIGVTCSKNAGEEERV
jgi:hypothetical protein